MQKRCLIVASEILFLVVYSVASYQTFRNQWMFKVKLFLYLFIKCQAKILVLEVVTWKVWQCVMLRRNLETHPAFPYHYYPHYVIWRMKTFFMQCFCFNPFLNISFYIRFNIKISDYKACSCFAQRIIVNKLLLTSVMHYCRHLSHLSSLLVLLCVFACVECVPAFHFPRHIILVKFHGKGLFWVHKHTTFLELRKSST